MLGFNLLSGINLKLSSSISAVERIPTFEDFFYESQRNTGFFTVRETGENYVIFPKQLAWNRLFSHEIPQQKRALLASRDKGKSELVTILGSAWELYKNPTVKIGIMTFKFENAEKLVSQIIEILSSFSVNLRHRSGGYYTDESRVHTPNLMPLSLVSNVRGMHFDYIILDDPLSTSQQYSKKNIEKSRAYLNESVFIGDRIILIGQLLTRNDVYYDALCNYDNSYFLLQSWFGDIPELDRDVKLLEQNIGKKDLARNYLGYINDTEEAIFKSIQFDTARPGGEYYAFIDPSAKGRDYTAVAIGGIVDGRIVILGKVYKAHWASCIDEILELCTGCYTVYYEDNLDITIEDYILKAGLIPKGVTTTTNKIEKIYALRGLIITDRLRLSTYMDALSISQVKNWTETAEYDDLPDAIAMLVKKIGWLTRY